jgi:two-component system sensor histidine kinase/response regulator
MVNAPENDIQPRPDVKSLLKGFDGDLDFFKQMAEIFLSDASPMLNTIRDAIQAQDDDTLMRTAHTLKGMLKNFQFEKAAQTAFRLEEAGRQKVFDNSRPAYEKLAGQLDEARKMLADMIKG